MLFRSQLDKVASDIAVSKCGDLHYVKEEHKQLRN
jgi:hypothetical protein